MTKLKVRSPTPLGQMNENTSSGIFFIIKIIKDLMQLEKSSDRNVLRCVRSVQWRRDYADLFGLLSKCKTKL